MFNNLLPFVKVALIWGVFCACKSDYNTPSFSCNGYTMQLSLQDSTHHSLQVSNNTFFRTPSDTGGIKYITLETAADSVKIIFNLKTGLYPDNTLWDDSMPVRTYTYSKQATGITSGLVVAGIKAGDNFQFADTDSSSITITEWNIRNQTMSGRYYFESNGHTLVGEGSFTGVCFVSLK
ncbi:hypothetical protein F0L74_04040 [Chitinophaga agrisoli]|uniref:Uncharacterized protein n=1 Tax=Chitinophaga agrisoli TaxID=2607653 RepID=A0A5B2W3B3_9BACT|nr:hypothetical protein [Chitinophaga agrisoli]KAA2245142.1 hypothetical protein F0L74_04040 [Chitinophaga agrisoli]